MSRKHLDLTDRCVIEKGLVLEQSFREIAASLNCSPSTVMREVRNNRIFVTTSKTSCENSYGCVKRKTAEAPLALTHVRIVTMGMIAARSARTLSRFTAINSTALHTFATPVKNVITV